MVVAIKFYDDVYYDNGYYAKVGGVSTYELNCLEVDLLSLLTFDLHVYPEQFAQYFDQLVLKCAQLNTYLDPLPAEELPSSLKGVPQVASTDSLYTVPSNGDIPEDPSH